MPTSPLPLLRSSHRHRSRKRADQLRLGTHENRLLWIGASYIKESASLRHPAESLTIFGRQSAPEYFDASPTRCMPHRRMTDSGRDFERASLWRDWLAADQTPQQTTMLRTGRFLFSSAAYQNSKCNSFKMTSM